MNQAQAALIVHVGNAIVHFNVLDKKLIINLRVKMVIKFKSTGEVPGGKVSDWLYDHLGMWVRQLSPLWEGPNKFILKFPSEHNTCT